MNKCKFCRLIKREIPANIVYEDSKVLAILDINPINKGHTLIIPKKHYADIYEIPDQYLKLVIITAKKIAKSMKKSLMAEGVNLLHASGKNSQQSVFHFHIHLVPRYKDDGMDTWPKSDYKEKDLVGVKNRIVRGLE